MDSNNVANSGITQQKGPDRNTLPHESGEKLATADKDAEDFSTPRSIVLEPGTRIKHYELIRKLGAGGMGTVFLARDVRLARLVAIKFLRDHGGVAVERFLTEALITAQCKHENIVVIYDVDEIDEMPYMALEYVEGRTLRDVVTGKKALTAAAAIELMVPVARALASAHEMGIVHRDLKPENILLSDSGQVKVLDFGIAKQVSVELAKTITKGARPVADVQLTQSGMLVGTMPYMSPEQWLMQPMDGRTDIWAVGIILFELVTGKHPLHPATLVELSSVADLERPMPSARERLLQSLELADVIDHCLKKRREERLDSAKALLEALERLDADKQSSNMMAEGSSPFAGLSAFQESDAARFFGRSNDTAAVVGRLRQQQLLTIAGASGAGKSSFVRAGVIPALKRTGHDIETFTIRPGRRPLAALADVLAFMSDTSSGSEEETNPVTLAKTLRTEPGYLGARLRARYRKRGADHQALLFVDQLEELYTQGIDIAERAAFCACIEGVADDASSPLRVIMTIRADFLDRVSEDRAFLTAMTRGLFFLPPMAQLGLREALERPLVAVGYRFEDEALCDEMLGALEGTRNPLPVLQFTANQLWEARDRKNKTLTRAAYEALGGVAGALSTHADAVLSGMSLPKQRMAKAILMRLVSPERTRAVVRLDELRALSDDRERLERVVQLLADARLLSIETGGDREGKTVELTHESLIERWSKLRQWLDENEKDAVFVGELRHAAAQWEKNDRADGLLWRDRAAIEAAQWLEQNKGEAGNEGTLGIGKRELLYLEAVVELSERTRRRRMLAMGVVFAFLSVIAVVVSLLGLMARDEARRADGEAEEAHRSAGEAKTSAEQAHKKATDARNATRMASAREHQSDPTLVLALIREMEPVGQLPPRWHELALFATMKPVAHTVIHHAEVIESVAFSPDGRYIVTSVGNTTQVWSADGTAKLVEFEPHPVRARASAWSPDGRRIASASGDKTVRIWNADGTGKPLVLEGHQAYVATVAFSPDGQHIVTASGDKTARVWNADGTGKPLVLEHPDEVASAAFSPDGGRIVTGSSDKSARIWNADGTGKPLVFNGHREAVWSVAWSPDGRRIVTGSLDGTARVWNADDTGKSVVFSGHLEAVRSVAWSPDSRRIVTASWDRSARVWNADGTGKPLVLEGHERSAYSAAFSPDGKDVITGSWDKTTRIWNVDATRRALVLDSPQAHVLCAEWSPDGRRIVAASGDKIARIWNADGTGEPLLFEGHQDKLWSASFSPDGTRIVTASEDRTARVWNANGTGKPIILQGHEAALWSASFSPDGKRIVTASRDETAWVWNTDGTGEPLVLRGHENDVLTASFSPDGRRIVTASSDGTARIWNADGSGRPVVLGHPGGNIWSASFSPDGKRIVTASADKTVRIWNADATTSSTPLVVLEGHTAAVMSGTRAGRGAWSPDGTQIVTVSDDSSVRIWNADGTGEPAILRDSTIDAYSAAFSPDGMHIVIASQSARDPSTGKPKFWATIWPRLQPIRGPDDPALWTATRYCPPIERRVELLGISQEEAKEQRAACQARVAKAFEHQGRR